MLCGILMQKLVVCRVIRLCWLQRTEENSMRIEFYPSKCPYKWHEAAVFDTLSTLTITCSFRLCFSRFFVLCASVYRISNAPDKMKPTESQFSFRPILENVCFCSAAVFLFVFTFSKSGKNHAIYYFAVRVERVYASILGIVFSQLLFSIVQMKMLYTTKLITKETNETNVLSVFLFFGFFFLPSLCFTWLYYGE